MPTLPDIKEQRFRIGMKGRIFIRRALASGMSRSETADSFMTEFGIDETLRETVKQRIAYISQKDKDAIAEERDRIAAEIAREVPIAHKAVRVKKLARVAEIVYDEIVSRFGVKDKGVEMTFSTDEGEFKIQPSSRTLKDLVDSFSKLARQIREESEGLMPAAGVTNVFLQQINQFESNDDKERFLNRLAERRMRAVTADEAD